MSKNMFVDAATRIAYESFASSPAPSMMYPALRRHFLLKDDDDAREFMKSERDCRMSIAAVEVDSFASLMRRYVFYMESAWRHAFETSAILFHTAARSRCETLRRQSENMEQAAYRSFLQWADMHSEWLDRHADHALAEKEFCYCVHSLRVVEVASRVSVINQYNEERFQWDVFHQKLLLGMRSVAEQNSWVDRAQGSLSVLATQESALHLFVYQGKKLWTSHALACKVKLLLDWHQLSEMEVVKYRWALLYRLEQAGRRHIVWRSLLRACLMVESWERLYILQLYARRTGELLWFHDEQRCLVIVTDEALTRYHKHTLVEARDRVQLCGTMFVSAVLLYARMCVVEQKEIVHRAAVGAACLAQLAALHHAIAGSYAFTRALHVEHAHQRLMLCESETVARGVLSDFLLSNFSLEVLHWQEVQTRVLRDRSAVTAIVPFLGYYDDSAASGGEGDAAREMNNAWDDIYSAPLVLRQNVEDGFGLYGQLVASSPPSHYRNPPISRTLQFSGVTRSTAYSLSPRTDSDSAAQFSETRHAYEREDNFSTMSSSSDELSFEHDSVAVSPAAASLPFFASGGTPRLALSVVALTYDEERARGFLEREAFRSHCVLILSGGLPSLEEAIRASIQNSEAQLVAAAFCAFSSGRDIIWFVDLEKRLRRRCAADEAEDGRWISQRFRFERDVAVDRRRLCAKYLDERFSCLADVIYSQFYDGAVMIARSENQIFQQRMASFDDDLLQLSIKAQRRLFDPAIQKLEEERRKMEGFLSSTPTGGRWYDTLVDAKANDAAGIQDWLAEEEPSPIALAAGEPPSQLRRLDFSSFSDETDDPTLGALVTAVAGITQGQYNRIADEESNHRRRLVADASSTVTQIKLAHVVDAEALFRLELWKAHVLSLGKVHNVANLVAGTVFISGLEQNARESLQHAVATQHSNWRKYAQQLLFANNMWNSRRRVVKHCVAEMSSLKTDILFTLFYEQAVELAQVEDDSYETLQMHQRTEAAHLAERQRVYYGLKLSDGVIMPQGAGGGGHMHYNAASLRTKEMYYHIRVTDSLPPARPLIARNDIILAIQGVRVVTLAAMRNELRKVKSNVVHFTILRAKDGATTTVTVRGVYKGESDSNAPSRSQSPSAFGRF